MVMEQLQQWFNISYLIWTRDVQVVRHDTMDDGSERVDLRIYTDTHAYSFYARVSGTRSYLGCTASSRKTRAGETQHRGNDLPDGPFTQETFVNILAAIVGYEAVRINIAKPGPGVPEKVMLGGEPLKTAEVLV